MTGITSLVGLGLDSLGKETELIIRLRGRASTKTRQAGQVKRRQGVREVTAWRLSNGENGYVSLQGHISLPSPR